MLRPCVRVGSGLGGRGEDRRLLGEGGPRRGGLEGGVLWLPDVSSGLGANQVSLVKYKVCMCKHDHGKGGVGSIQSPPSPTTTMQDMVMLHILNTMFLLLENLSLALRH